MKNISAVKIKREVAYVECRTSRVILAIYGDMHRAIDTANSAKPA